MSDTFERITSYQELLTDLKFRKEKLYQEAHDKTIQADTINEVCIKLQTAVDYETKIYKQVERL